MKHSEYLCPDLCSQDNLILVEQESKLSPYKHQLPNPTFDKVNLEKMPDHRWMTQVQMTLVHPDIFPDLITDFLPTLIPKCTQVPDYVMPPMEHLPYLMALDLETTGLGRTIQIIGGNPTVPERIVGICIATSSTDGYYIPVLHNQTDKIKNYPYAHAMDFLRELQRPDLLMVYHRAQYDREILETNNIELNPEYIDSMLLMLNMNYKSDFFTVALKVLAAKLLKRPMLEIKDLSGVKEYIPLQYYPASSLLVYGSSDGCNTYALMMHALTHPTKNPYKVNKFPMRLDMKTCDYTRWMLRPGLPLDYETLKLNLRTLIRRRILVIRKFKKEVTPTVDIGSPDQVGIYLGSLIYNNYKEFRKSANLNESDLFKEYQHKAFELFNCEVKEKKLKSGTIKVTYSSGDDILSSYKNIDSKEISWISQKDKDSIKTAAALIGIYRSIVHDMGAFASMYRYAYTDDLNMHRTTVGLNFNGTITNRYSNASGEGSLARYSIRRLVKSTSLNYKNADTACGINLQGINSSPMKLEKAMKLTAAPKEFLDEKRKLDNEVEVYLRAYLEEM